MDLNKAWNTSASMFTNGNEGFQGSAMMPMIDGAMAYNQKHGYTNAYKYVKEVVKKVYYEKDQLLARKRTVINGLVKSNTLPGYKGPLALIVRHWEPKWHIRHKEKGEISENLDMGVDKGID
jgi:hypothetical protein